MILENQKYFNSRIKIAKLLYKQGLYEDCLNFLKDTATFAWCNFTGYYKSSKIEMLLENISRKLFHDLKVEPKEKQGPKKVLHICSEVYNKFGHSKLLYNWLSTDTDSIHTVFATRMNNQNLQNISEGYIDIANIELIGGLQDSIVATAQNLRQICTQYDYIILHIHPDDIIPNLAFANLKGQPPTLFLNHADHTFWLGTRVLDYIIQIRESNIDLDAERRGIPVNKQYFLPIPIKNSNVAIREKPSDELIQLLSTGSEYKFKPNQTYNFLREAKKIVEKFPNTVFNIVGISIESEYARQYLHERLIYHGTISPKLLAKIETDCDIYVESFPMPSFTALLEVGMLKKPFLLHYKPLPIFQLFKENYKYKIVYPKDLNEWCKTLEKLIQNADYRSELTKKQYNFLLNEYSIMSWKNKLSNIYITTKPYNKANISETKDIAYYGENEILLSTIGNCSIEHFSFTHKLTPIRKLIVLMRATPKHPQVIYFDKAGTPLMKEVIKYIINY